MAGKTKAEANAERWARYVVQEAYSEVMGRQFTDTVAALTIGDLAQQRIDQISKDQSTIRPSELNQLLRLEKQITEAVKYIKAVNPDKFKSVPRKKNVNTPKVGAAA